MIVFESIKERQRFGFGRRERGGDIGIGFEGISNELVEQIPAQNHNNENREPCARLAHSNGTHSTLSASRRFGLSFWELLFWFLGVANHVDYAASDGED